MTPASENSPRPEGKSTAADTKSAATWVRAKRAPRRKRTDDANALQLGAITLASNSHA